MQRTLAFAGLLAVVMALPAVGQSLLERVQGLYYPAQSSFQWNCRDVAGEGGALAIQGNAMIGVESVCTLQDPFPIPGMDAIRFTRSCSGEGEAYAAAPIVLTTTDRGIAFLSDGIASEWLRCP